MTFPLMKIASGESEKSRIFSVRRLAYLRADRLWEPRKGKRSQVRPAFLAFLGSRAGCQAFCANLMAEREALCEGETFSVSKKAGYRWMHQEVPGGVVTCWYLPQLFHLEPVEDPGWVRFVFAPPRWWVEAQAVELRLEVAGVEGANGQDAAEAALFAAFLDRRTTLPILRELRFQLQLYLAAKEAGFVTRTRDAYQGFDFAGFTECGLRPPLAVCASYPTVVEFLKEQINTYRETYHGTTASPAGGRLLSYPEAPSFQYCLFDQVAQ
jgi:hypothetical protein